MAFKFEGKEMKPIFVFATCCWSNRSKVIRLGKNAQSKQGKATSTQILQLNIKFMPMYRALFVKTYLTDLAQKLLSLREFSDLSAEIAISAHI